MNDFVNSNTFFPYIENANRYENCNFQPKQETFLPTISILFVCKKAGEETFPHSNASLNSKFSNVEFLNYQYPNVSSEISNWSLEIGDRASAKVEKFVPLRDSTDSTFFLARA